MKKRNPHASVLSDKRFRPKVAKNAHDRAKQRDPFERNSKYPIKATDIDDIDDLNDLQIGDNVKYVGNDKKLKGKEGLVKNPNGPAGLVGTIFDGEYSLIPQAQLRIIEESISKMRNLSEMKYIEVTSGVRIPISAEEQEILDLIGSGSVNKSSLDERQQEVARLMVTRGLLKRIANSDKKTISFVKNKSTLRRD